MKTLTVYPDSINSRAIDDAVRILRDGGIVIYPTDTIYALGCNALDNRAVERLCRLKGINPDKHLLSIVCSSLSQAAEYAKIIGTVEPYRDDYDATEVLNKLINKGEIQC